MKDTLELKFKIYDPKTQCCHDCGEIHFCHGGIKAYGTGIMINNTWVTSENSNPNKPEIALLQFTGVLDYDGEEIYNRFLLRYPNIHYNEDDGSEPFFFDPVRATPGGFMVGEHFLYEFESTELAIQGDDKVNAYVII